VRFSREEALPAWSLVVTAPHRERTVARMLSTLELPYHLFCELRQQVWRGRIVEKPYPVFPGYLFCACHGFYDAVRAIGGVLGFVRFGEKTVVVDEHIVNRLVASSVGDVLPRRVIPIVSRFRAGEAVRVSVSGRNVLAGQVGRFQRLLGIDRQAIIELEWMGRWVPVPVDERDLESEIDRRKRKRRKHRSSARMASSSALALSSV
jgi:transcription antitermination factor NusG